MCLLAVALVIIIVLISHGNCYYAKCCKSGEYITEADSIYKCVENKPKRLYVISNDTDLLGNINSDECVDASTDYFTFNVSNGKIVEKTHLKDNYFPKCCPLNYIYNSALHACEESDKFHDFINLHLIKVGLSNCTTIVDYELNYTGEPLKVVDQAKGMRGLPQAPDSYCIDRNEKDAFVLRKCAQDLQVCEGIRCIRKCCPDGQSFINKSTCYDTYTHGLNLSTLSNVDNPEGPFAIIHGRSRKCQAIYIMERKDYHNFTLDDKGAFKIWTQQKTLLTFDVKNRASYCIEHAKKGSIDAYLFFRCAPDTVVSDKYIYTRWAKAVSIAALLLTIFVYIILRKTRNLFGKILVNYCVSLVATYVVLIYAQTYLTPSPIDCKIRSFLIIYFATAIFSWSNVICYDIYRKFRSTRQSLERNQGGTKKLLMYLIYGWGVPTVLTLVTYLFYAYKVLPYSIQPLLENTRKCFLEKRQGNYSHALFFNTPHLIIQLINTALFMKTVAHCLNVQKEISKINDSTKDDKRKRFQKDKERLFLILKLSVIMGVSFISEVVSAYVLDMETLGTVAKYTEIIFDFINCLQGLLIFIIFICKQKILQELSRNFRCLQIFALPRNVTFSSIYNNSTTVSSEAMKTSFKVDDNNRET